MPEFTKPASRRTRDDDRPRRPVGRPRKNPVPPAETDGSGKRVAQAGSAGRRSAKSGTTAVKSGTRAKRAGSLSASNGKTRTAGIRDGTAVTAGAAGTTGSTGIPRTGRTGRGKGRPRQTAPNPELAETIAYGEGTGRSPARNTRKRILAAARLLFARHGMDGVSVRAIAEEAGVNHALVHRYFGSKMDMVTEIVQNEIAAFGEMSMPHATVDFQDDLRQIRAIIHHVLTNMKTTVLLVLRAEMDGLNPSQVLLGLTPRGSKNLADWITAQQAQARAEGLAGSDTLPDPKAVAMIVSGAIFALVAAEPWMASAVALSPESDKARLDLLVDTLVAMLAQAVGRPQAV